MRVTVDSRSFYCGGREHPYDLQQSHGDNTGKMTMNRRGRRKKGNRKGRKKSWSEFDGEGKGRGGGGVNSRHRSTLERLWKAGV